MCIRDRSKEAFYIQSSRVVIRLEQSIPSGGFKPAGTGFFVQDETGQLYLVTARHVADGSGDLRSRVPVLNASTSKTEIIELRLPTTRWVYHPKGGDEKDFPVDVAVMKLPGIKDRSIVSFRYCPKDCPKDEYDQLASDPAPPDQLVIFGFPLDLGFTLTEPRPMTRLGVVAMISDDPFIYVDVPGGKKMLQKGAFLIDARMFPGNSGGPLIVMNPLSKLTLGGLITATNRNLDYAIATPASQVKETIEQARSYDISGFSAWFVIPKP